MTQPGNPFLNARLREGPMNQAHPSVRTFNILGENRFCWNLAGREATMIQSG